MLLHWIVGCLVFVAGISALGSLVLSLAPSDTPPQPADLVLQIQNAASGTAESQHVYGGPIQVSRRGGQLSITASKVPTSACVSAGWTLAREGVLAVNGLRPSHISAGILADLCNREGDLASMTWMPKGRG